MVYHADWLGDLWQRPGQPPEEFIARGWDECLVALDRLDAALRTPHRASDPCLATGAGWIAEEALATGLCASCSSPTNRSRLPPRRRPPPATPTRSPASRALRRRRPRLGAWPADWLDRIEYADQLARMCAAWS